MTSLSNRAMLVSLNVSLWEGRRYDRGISREVADNHGSDLELGRFNKSLLDKGALLSITKAVSALRTWHDENTLPWLQRGANILPSGNYFAYMAGISQRRIAFDAAVREFCGAYDSHIEEAKRKLNGLFRQSDYPTREQVARRFNVDCSVVNLPDASDWRVQLGDDEEARIKADIERRGADAIAQANNALWERCHNVVSAMADRLSAYDVTVGADGKPKVAHPFRDSLVTNIRELVDLLPRLNLTGSAELDIMRQRIEAKLAQHEAQDLRDSDALRKVVAKDAAAILASMSAYTGMTTAEAA
jgi:hypothetical protein